MPEVGPLLAEFPLPRQRYVDPDNPNVKRNCYFHMDDNPTCPKCKGAVRIGKKWVYPTIPKLQPKVKSEQIEANGGVILPNALAIPADQGEVKLNSPAMNPARIAQIQEPKGPPAGTILPDADWIWHQGPLYCHLCDILVTGQYIWKEHRDAKYHRAQMRDVGLTLQFAPLCVVPDPAKFRIWAMIRKDYTNWPWTKKAALVLSLTPNPILCPAWQVTRGQIRTLK